MKRIVEVEEIVKIHHQIFVDYDSDEELDDALDTSDAHSNSLEDYVMSLQKCGIKVTKTNENYSEETDSVEYYDDYEED